MNTIYEILSGIRPEVDFRASQHFIEEGLLDSFDMVTLVAALDRAYGISIDGVDIVPGNFQSASSIMAMLSTYGISA